MNVEQLKADVYLAYENPFVTEQFDWILRYAEARMRRDVQTREIEQSEHGSTSEPYIELPDDVLVMQRIVITVNGREYGVPIASHSTQERFTDSTSRPYTYNIQDQVIMLYPSPDTSYEYSLYFIPKIRPLTFNANTNWVLETAPDIYLYACLAQAAIGVRDSEGRDEYLGLYQNAWTDYVNAAERMKYSMSDTIQIHTIPSA